ncbi:MAG: aspartate kinase [Kiritimatiellaeota bacterium]|nr:aspartate kinase [Kiritimatiellota bacterium]
MLKVCKFGGSSLADAAQVSKVCDIVLADPGRRVVVVSAPGKRRKDDTKVTDLLITCAEQALAGKDAEPPLCEIVERYAEIQRDLGLEPALAADIEGDLRRRLALDRSHAGMFMDAMKAAGEDNSARLLAAALRARGVAAAYASPAETGMLLSEEFGNAQLLPESLGLLHAKLSAPSGVIVYPGFFGVTKSGHVATFPRGGSDITGSILAAALHADVYENFTDVSAVYPVDPRVVPGVTRGIGEMTYREMRELAYAGFGVFHDEAVLPAIRAGIPINIRNTNAPADPGTWIRPAREHNPGQPVVGIASDTGFVNVYIDKFLMNREVGFGLRLLQILADENIPYEHMPSGIDNVSLVLRGRNFDAAAEARVMARIHAELKPDNTQVDRGYALVMIVGEGMQYTVGLTARAARALSAAGVNIEMINQGASEISIMFGIQEADRANAVRALYAEFFNP